MMKLILLAGASALTLAATSAEAAVYSFNTPGPFNFTAATAGTYDIFASGAAGSDSIYHNFGRGANIDATFTLSAGEMLSIFVGSRGGYAFGAGTRGGDGSFVAGPGNTPLVVAGGGGGAAGYRGYGYGGGDGLTGTSGGDGGGYFGDGGAGGLNGGDGGNGSGGLYQDQPGQGGKGFNNGALGGASGGYGYGGGGGGGGFSGGGGGAGRYLGARGGGGGGGSFVGSGGTLISAVSGANGGAGLVTITSPDAVPEPTTWSMMLTGFGFLGYTLRRRMRGAVRLV